MAISARQLLPNAGAILNPLNGQYTKYRVSITMTNSRQCCKFGRSHIMSISKVSISGLDY
eukprot:scaffold602942_cov18-Prasinocladus_malaysianus.AAC.1